MSSSPSETTTLHLLRSPPDPEVRALQEPLLDTPGATSVSLTDEDLDYDDLLCRVFSARRVICWW